MAARRWKHLREQGYRHMSERVIVIGASGHGKVVADIIRRSGDTLLGFLDDNETLLPEITGIPVLGKVADYVKYIEASFVVGIGNSAVVKRLRVSLTVYVGTRQFIRLRSFLQWIHKLAWAASLWQML